MSELALQLIEKEKQEKTGKLDLGNCGLTDIPKEVFELTWLEELSFCNEVWDHHSEKWMSSTNEGSGNFISIEELPAGFEVLNTLKILHFGGNGHNKKWGVKICNVLGNLEQLQTLYLCSNQINDIGFFKKLTELQYLNISYNEINDISYLEKLVNLKCLDLKFNQISDYSILSKLTYLQFLEINDKQINEYSFLKKLTKLHSLDLSDNQIIDYSFLEELTNLKKLDLSYNEINDISFLEKLTSLHFCYIQPF